MRCGMDDGIGFWRGQKQTKEKGQTTSFIVDVEDGSSPWTHSVTFPREINSVPLNWYLTSSRNNKGRGCNPSFLRGRVGGLKEDKWFKGWLHKEPICTLSSSVYITHWQFCLGSDQLPLNTTMPDFSIFQMSISPPLPSPAASLMGIRY